MIVCTFPGKYGDLLWALPTVRAISRRVGAPVHLRVSAGIASIVPLLQQQPYLASVKAYLDWTTENTAPISPRVPSAREHEVGTVVLNLGYRGWPTPNVVEHTRLTANDEASGYAWLPAEGHDYLGLRWDPIRPEDLALGDPWITCDKPLEPYFWPWMYGFTDEYFELKYGLVRLLEGEWTASILGGMSARRMPPICLGDNPRWRREAGETGTNWIETVEMITHAGAFLSDCSALHVLAVACGVPVVLVEPQAMRHNPVFYPLGTTGPQVTLVTGGDGLPTFDARHVRETLTRVAAARTAQRE